jgi:uncharacterized protein YecE (DUF72 family)
VSGQSILIGTSSFTANGWKGAFYPVGLKSSDYLPFYAEHFDTVEIDSTFYACPSPQTVTNWALRTPKGFVFSLKVPQTITHEKMRVACAAEFEEFIKVVHILDEKLGVVVFQFPFFDKWRVKDRHEFTDRLIPFLKKLPSGYKFAIEIRNKQWLDAEFAEMIRTYKVGLVLQDLSYMPLPTELDFDPITADFTYIRWLGDRKGIETRTQTWNKVVDDKTDRLISWVDYCQQIQKRGIKQYIYANNHFEGFSPATVAKFRGLWSERGLGELATRSIKRESSLFE